MKGIDKNAEAVSLLENLIMKQENRIRHIYNLGYNAGFNDGVREATEKIILKVTGQGEDEE